MGAADDRSSQNVGELHDVMTFFWILAVTLACPLRINPCLFVAASDQRQETPVQLISVRVGAL